MFLSKNTQQFIQKLALLTIIIPSSLMGSDQHLKSITPDFTSPLTKETVSPIQQKIEKHAKDASAEELNLVVGSTRFHNKTYNFIKTKLWGENKADLKHQKSFKGKTTTLDQLPCHSRASHLTGDARNYNFEYKKLRNVYFERVDTTDLKNRKISENYIGDCIKHIALSMPKSAVLEIEWHPFIMLLQDPTMRTGILEYSLKKSTKNPFTGFFELNVARIAGYYVAGTVEEKYYSQEMLRIGRNIADQIEPLLLEYAEKGMGSLKTLKKRLRIELELLDMMLRENKNIALSCNPSASHEDFFESTQCPGLVSKQAPIPVDLPILTNGPMGPHFITIYNTDTFIINTLFNFVLSDIAVMQNKPLVIEFLQKQGFADVTLERKTSPVNGRKNVWILKGINTKEYRGESSRRHLLNIPEVLEYFARRVHFTCLFDMRLVSKKWRDTIDGMKEIETHNLHYPNQTIPSLKDWRVHFNKERVLNWSNTTLGASCGKLLGRGLIDYSPVDGGKTKNQINQLILRNNKLSSQFILDISEGVIKNSLLTILDLSYNPIEKSNETFSIENRKGAIALGNLLRESQNLEFLHLKKCTIDFWDIVIMLSMHSETRWGICDCTIDLKENLNLVDKNKIKRREAIFKDNHQYVYIAGIDILCTSVDAYRGRTYSRLYPADRKSTPLEGSNQAYKWFNYDH